MPAAGRVPTPERNEMRTKLLIIEDCEEEGDLLQTTFSSPEFLPRLEPTGEKGLECALAWKPNCVILDLGLPGIPGLEVCRLLKKDARTRTIPILILSAHNTKEEIIQGLNSGGDDYLTKPFSIGELLARVQALLRRYPAAQNQDTVLKAGPLTLDLAGRSVYVGKNSVPSLTPKEFDLLEVLVRSAGNVLSRQRFLETIWGYDLSITPRTVDQHVTSLRKKLGPSVAKSIQAVSKVGYCLRLKKDSR